MKYSNNFERDFNWLLSARKDFTFSGKPIEEVVYNKDGMDGKKAFFEYDAKGKRVATKHPNILSSLIKTKASVNFQIKEWAISRASCDLPLILFKEIETELKLLPWIVDAVESQKCKYAGK